MPLQPGATLENGKYWIEAALGRGGFGYVYRARERLTGETVAIKELVPALVGDPEVVRRFIQEARATLRLTHPHIARTYHIFQDGDTYYLAMEYLAGGSLADRMERGPLPLDVVLRIAGELCAALEYAHEQGVVHCDLKPANVLLDEHGGVHLADFGVAHVSEQMMTRQVVTGTGMTMGTVRYMSPEQLEGVRDDPRVDIYALGAIVYEMLAGRPYLDFETDTTPAAQVRNLQRIQTQPPRPLRSVNPAVPDWLARVVDRALRKAPGERFQSAAAFAQALQQRRVESAAGVDVARRQVVPPPPTERMPPAQPRPRRGLRGWQWGVIAVLALAVIGLCAAAGWLLAGGGDGLLPRASDTPRPVVVVKPTSTPEPAATPTLQPSPTVPPPSLAEQEKALLAGLHWRAQNGKPIVAHYAQQPPVIDGHLDVQVEWPGIERVIAGAANVVYQPQNWQGPADQSASLRVVWDEQFLYLGLDIRDDRHVQLSSGADLYAGDDVEIQFDADLEGDLGDSGLSGDDGQMGLAVTDLPTGQTDAYRWRPPALEGPLSLTAAARQSPNGYLLEVAIPWSALNLTPRVETPYGFCLSLADTDTPGLQVQESMISTCPNRKWGDPTTWGTLILVDW